MGYLDRKPGSLEEVIADKTKLESGDQEKFKREMVNAGKGVGSMTPKEKSAFFSKLDEIKEAMPGGANSSSKMGAKWKAAKKKRFGVKVGQHEPKGKELEESDAYDNDRFIIIGNTAKKDNSDTPDNKNHVYAPDSKTALQLYKQGKKVYKEEVLDEFTNFKSITFKPKGKYVSDGKYEIVYDYVEKLL